MEGLRPDWVVKAIAMIAMASILLRHVSAAENHTVGGVFGWDLSSNLQAWASETTFRVGDSLVFSYTPVHDVVEVDNDGYQSCDASSPIATHNDGETVVPLGREGPRYFICGRRGHCRMGLKLQAQVLAADEKSRGGGGKKRRSPPGSPSGGGSADSAPSPQRRACGPQKAAVTRLVAAVVIVLVASYLP